MIEKTSELWIIDPSEDEDEAQTGSTYDCTEYIDYELECD
jgi:hypothetical protein